MVIIGGWVFLMSEVTLYRDCVPRTSRDIMSRWLQEYLAYKKTPHPGTLQKAYAYGPMVVLGGGAVSYESGTPVTGRDLARPSRKGRHGGHVWFHSAIGITIFGFTPQYSAGHVGFTPQ